MAKNKPAEDPGEPLPFESLDINFGSGDESDDDAPALESAGGDVNSLAQSEQAELPATVAATLRQWGYEVSDDASDDDVRSHLEELESRASKFDEVSRELEMLRSQRRPDHAPEQQRAPAAEANASDEDDIPKPPKLDDFVVKIVNAGVQSELIKEGPGGVYTTDDPSLAGYVQKANEFVAAKRAYDSAWQENPYEFVSKQVERRLAKERDDLRKQILEEMEGKLKSEKTYDKIHSYFVDNKKAYFDLGADGEPVWDSSRGTWAGKRYAEYMAATQEARQLGISDPESIHKFASRLVPPVVPEASVQETPQQKVVRFNSRLSRNGNSALSPSPVRRNHAGVSTRELDGLPINQQIGTIFNSLMNEGVAERM